MTGGGGGEELKTYISQGSDPHCRPQQELQEEEWPPLESWVTGDPTGETEKLFMDSI